MPDKNGVWKIATGAVAVVLLCTGAMWGMIGAHASHPHDTSLPRTEFEQFMNTCFHRLERIENKVDLILERGR